MKKAIVLLILFTAFLYSCDPCRRCTIEPEIQRVYVQKDTVIYETIWQDTVIKIPVPNDELLIRAMIECDSANRAQLDEMIFKSKSQYIKLKIENGMLTETAQLTADSLIATIKIQKEIITKLQNKINTTTKTKVITKKVTPGWIKPFAWIGGVIVFLALLFFVWNIYKRRVV